jgi:hypothetical protein
MLLAEGSRAVAFVHDEREPPVVETAAAPNLSDDAAVVPSAPSRDAQGRRWTAKVPLCPFITHRCCRESRSRRTRLAKRFGRLSPLS